MEELIVKVDNLIDKIDNSKLVKDIKRLNTKIKEDNELMRLLEEFQYNKTDKIKEKILSNELFNEYKLKETDLNILIMYINKELKRLNNERSCFK